MKKAIKTMLMLFVASTTLVLTSCGTDEDVKDVELTMIPAATSGTHFGGDSVSITINAKGNSDNKLKKLIITKAKTGSPTTTILDQTLSGTDYIYTLKQTFDNTDAGSITYTITLQGEKGTNQTKTYTANIKVAGLISDETQAVTLFGQTAAAETQQFIALNSFTTYTKTQASDNSYDALKNKIDLVFYYGTNNKFTLSSPSDAVMQGLYSGFSSFWTSADNKRITGLYKATGLINYTGVVASSSDREIQILAEGKTFSNTLTQLALNDLILFKTTEGKLGLLRVREVKGNTSADAEFIFDGVVQQN